MIPQSKISIIPTVLANTKNEFDDRLARLLPISKELQVDFMDGKFVPSTGVTLNDIPDLKRWAAWSFEAHLMVYHPETWIEELHKKGFKRVIFHFEAVKDKEIEQIADLIREHEMIPVIAINPETSPKRILKYAQFVDGILLMGVHPGFNGAPYVPEQQRIAELTTLFKEIKNPPQIQIDGGMKPETISAVVAAGAIRINSGSYVNNAPNPLLALNALYIAAQPLSSTRPRNKLVAKKKSTIKKKKPTKSRGAK